MKDRYDNFFDAQQDPYEYDADDERDAEEYEEDELEDEESLEEDDELEDEESEYDEADAEEGDEDSEYDEEEEDGDSEYDEEDEEEAEEEDVPAAQSAAPRPFGNSLNIQRGNMNRNNDYNSDRNGRNQPGRPDGGTPQGSGQGMVFKQVRPAAPAGAAAGQPNRFAQPARPAQSQPVRPDRAEALSNITQKSGEPAEEDPQSAEEMESVSPKRSFLSKLAPWNWGKSHFAEPEDEDEEINPEEEEMTDEEFDGEDVPRQGRFRRLLSAFSRHSADAETEAEEEESEENPADTSDRKIARLGQRVSEKFSSFSNRVRGRLRTGETLDEFKEELADSDEDDDKPAGGRFRRLVKTGMIGGAAALLIFAGYTGYRHLTGSDSGTDSASAGLASPDEQASDTLSGLSSRADSSGSETTPLDSIAEGLDTLGDKISGQVDSLAEKANEQIDSVTAALTSGAPNEDILSNDDLLDGDSLGSAAGAVAGAAAAAAAGVASLTGKSGTSEDQAAGDDLLDFGFDSPQSSDSADDSLSGSLSASETTPAYGDNQGDDALSFSQIKENLSDAGEQLKDGFKSGVEKVDNSLKKAGEKTGEFFDNAGQKLSGAAQDFKNDMAQAGEQAQDAAQKVGDWASSTYDGAKEKIGDAAASVKSGLSQAGGQAQDAAQKVGDWAGNTYDGAKTWTQDTAGQISGALQPPANTAVPSATPQPTAGTLPNGGSQTQILSLGQSTPSEPLFLESSARGQNTVSSLGGSAGQFQPASNAVSGGRDTPLGTAVSSAAAGSLGAAALSQNSSAGSSLNGGLSSSTALNGSLGNAAQNVPAGSLNAGANSAAPAQNGLNNSLNGGLSSAPQNTAALPAQDSSAPLNSAPAEIQDALAQEAAAARSAAAQQVEVLQGQTPDETFAAETDLSTIGFEAPRVEDGDPLSDSLSPFGGQYTLPEETVPAANLNPAAPNAAVPGANTPAAGQPAQQLSVLDYNPADPAASARYNNGTQAGGLAAQGSGYRQYRTKAGDNLIKIAENELGDGTRWSEISRLNPNMNLRGRLDEGLLILLPARNNGN